MCGDVECVCIDLMMVHILYAKITFYQERQCIVLGHGRSLMVLCWCKLSSFFAFLLFSSFLMGASVTLKLVNYCIYSWERISRFQRNGSDFRIMVELCVSRRGGSVVLHFNGMGIKLMLASSILFRVFCLHSIRFFFSLSRWFLSAVNGWCHELSVAIQIRFNFSR